NSDIIITTNFDEFDDERKPLAIRLLDINRETSALYDQFRLAYSGLLYHWGLYEARAEVLKFMSFVKTTVGSPLGEMMQPLEIGVYCYRCGAQIKPNTKCGNCKHLSGIGIKCSICHQIVKGLTTFCISCRHGGHTLHIREWFASGYEECPTGCGCPCVAKGGGFFGVDEEN
ncbi:372_t:CDS:2, partial [Acaulospora morrowiae]